MAVLDTHAWLWWMHDPSQLSRAARDEIEERHDSSLHVSAISVWEIAVKHALGKLTLPMELKAWYAETRTYPRVRLHSVTAEQSIASVLLPGPLHRDPADRLIVALARTLDAPLITADRALRAYPHVRTVW